MKFNNQIATLFGEAYRLTETPAGGAAAGGGAGGVATLPPPAAAPAGGAAVAPPAGSSGPAWGPPSVNLIREALQGKPPAADGGTAPAKLPDKVNLSMGEDGKWHATDDATGAEIGSGFDSEASATTHLKSLEQAAAGEPPASTVAPGTHAADWMDSPFGQPLMNRHKTPREALEALVRSEGEGLRLNDALKSLQKQHQAEIADRDAKLAALQTEIQTVKTMPPFKELTKEELTELAKADPLAANEYLLKKEFRDRDMQTAKEKAAANVQAQKAHYSQLNSKIKAEYDTMASNEKDFPLFKELGPIMDAIIDETATFRGEDGKMYSPLCGHLWSNKVCYDIAYARACRQAQAKAATVTKRAEETARLTAEAAARVTGGGAQPGSGNGSGTAAKGAAEREEQAYHEGLRKASQTHNFFG